MLRHLLPVLVSSTALLVASPVAAQDKKACIDAHEKAQQLDRQGKLKDERAQLLVCAQASCPKLLKKDCATWLERVDAAQPSVVLQARDPAGKDVLSVGVWVDGARVAERLDGKAIPLDPGVHRFHYEMEGAAPVDEEIAILPGVKNRVLTISFKARSPATLPEAAGAAGWRPPVAMYVLAGAGAVALGLFTGFAVDGRAKALDLAAGCGKTKSCTESQVQPAKSALLAADVSLGLGLSAVVAGAITAGVSRATWAPVSAGVTLSPHGRALQLTGSF